MAAERHNKSVTSHDLLNWQSGNATAHNNMLYPSDSLPSCTSRLSTRTLSTRAENPTLLLLTLYILDETDKQVIQIHPDHREPNIGTKFDS